MGDLAIRELTGNDDHSPATELDERRIVCGVATTRVRSTKHRGTERLRSLHRDQRLTRRCLDDNAVAVHDLDRVSYGDARNGAVSTRCHGTDDRAKQGGGCERARRVVHAHDRRLHWHCGETGADRFAARRSSGNTALSLHFRRRHDEHDTAADRPRDFRGVIDDAARADQLELLGPAESSPTATGDDHRPHNLVRGKRHDRRG